ncbi:MAG: hypothetical protein SGILL_009246 [Bacillariaceae sp.]
MAYLAVANGLKDTNALLEGYTDAVLRTEYLSQGKALLLEAGQEGSESDASKGNDSNASPMTATVAVAAASVSFVVASIVCYGFMRKGERHHPEPSVRHKVYSRKSNTKTIAEDSRGVRTRRHFVRLEDLSGSPTSFVTATMTPSTGGYGYPYQEPDEYFCEESYAPSTGWSVSDVTWSDSASLRSGVSRTPSMLERIEEEVEDNEDFERSDGTFRCGKSRLIQSVRDFDCKSQQQETMADISDLDACFTIVSESPGHDEGDGPPDTRAGVEVPDGSQNGPHKSGLDMTESSILDQGEVNTIDESDTSIENLQGVEKVDNKATIDAGDMDELTAVSNGTEDDDEIGPAEITKEVPVSVLLNGAQGETSTPVDDTNDADADGHDAIFAPDYLLRHEQDHEEEDEGTTSLAATTSSESLASKSSTVDDHPRSVHGSSTNMEDSIEEWVSELLHELPRDG